MKQTRRRARPTLMEAGAAALFAAMGLCVLTAARLLGDEWSGMEAAVVWEGARGALLMALAAMLTGRIRPAKREERLRMELPTIAQGVLTLLCVIAAVLFQDDITLFFGALLQRMGMDVSHVIGAMQPAGGWLYIVRVILIGMLPPIATEWFFHGAQMAAWERRGSMYAMWTTSLMCTLLCGNIVRIPAELALSMAAGFIIVKTGSLFLGAAFRMGTSVAAVAARQVQAVLGMESARLGRLWTEIGGRRGWCLLGIETLLLGVVLLFTVRAVCCAKPREAAPWRERQTAARPMNAAEVFVLCAAVTTGFCTLFADLMQMTGIF